MENKSTPGDRLNNFTGEERAQRWWLVPLIVAVGVAGSAAVALAYSSGNSHRLEVAPGWVLAIGGVLTLLAVALAWALTSYGRRGAEIRSQQALLANVVADAVSERKAAESEIFLEQAGAISGVGGFRIDLHSGRQVWTRQTFKIYDVEGDVAPSAEEFDRLMAPDVGARSRSRH
jgi:hypothetical protein